MVAVTSASLVVSELFHGAAAGAAADAAAGAAAGAEVGVVSLVLLLQQCL